jgi:hypothetical protein
MRRVGKYRATMTTSSPEKPGEDSGREGAVPFRRRPSLYCRRAVATPGTAPTDALVQAACDLTTWTQALLLDGELAVANQDAAVSGCGT